MYLGVWSFWKWCCIIYKKDGDVYLYIRNGNEMLKQL